MLVAVVTRKVKCLYLIINDQALKCVGLAQSLCAETASLTTHRSNAEIAAGCIARIEDTMLLWSLLLPTK